MGGRCTFEWNHPLTAVWFPATEPSGRLYHHPPCLDPVAHITEVMQKAKTACSCAPPRLWNDLLVYHGIWEGMTNPMSASVFNVVGTFCTPRACCLLQAFGSLLV